MDWYRSRQKFLFTTFCVPIIVYLFSPQLPCSVNRFLVKLYCEENDWHLPIVMSSKKRPVLIRPQLTAFDDVENATDKDNEIIEFIILLQRVRTCFTVIDISHWFERHQMYPWPRMIISTVHECH